MKKIMMFSLLSLLTTLPAMAEGIFSQWINPAGAISEIALGQGNRFLTVATQSFRVDVPSTVIITGTTETFLASDNGSGRFQGMGGIYRVGFSLGQSPALRFQSLNAGGAGISSTNVQMPLAATAMALNVPAGKYEAYISIYGNEGVNFKPLRYLTKAIQIQVIPN